ncbi:hypothetical protein GPECTOR_20g516 [Gonium pectorale]|uniref:Uncharacterized protein n=1 Tax=Gonium pectorale TaxID=33097 RepID=A0A150GIL8_GONPE|nr:hypothetical protein GPECTOR_20g516 [Gonium pectorale]|eukprot:KXZ49659.1 hypothetical protein GPECTOR_20g516 [Gonium pectorale]
MGLINLLSEKPVHLVLSKDRVLRELPRAPAGSLALLKTADGEILAKGYYDPGSKLAFRTFALQKDKLDESLVAARLGRAARLRDDLFGPYDSTNGFRLVNGEGDGLPGLVVDVYNDTAVMKLDGAGAESFYNAEEVAGWLRNRHPRLRTVFLKYRAGGSGPAAPAAPAAGPAAGPPAAGQRQGPGGAAKRGSAAAADAEAAARAAATVAAAADEGRGRLLSGEAPAAGRPVRFVENGVQFQADVVQGQKTGFFLDQRENRSFVGRLSRGRRVLNVFGYTGGFSIYAGVGGAADVTTVDVGRAALSYADANWALNGLEPSRHTAAAEDAFEFLDRAAKARERWDVVIIDPPSFAPNKAAVEKARAAYAKLFAAAAVVTAPHGCLSLASCSSHIDSAMFMEICDEALGRARRQGYVLRVAGQPADHPFPAAADELRYLKFVTFRLEG